MKNHAQYISPHVFESTESVTRMNQAMGAVFRAAGYSARSRLLLCLLLESTKPHHHGVACTDRELAELLATRSRRSWTNPDSGPQQIASYRKFLRRDQEASKLPLVAIRKGEASLNELGQWVRAPTSYEIAELRRLISEVEMLTGDHAELPRVEEKKFWQCAAERAVERWAEEHALSYLPPTKRPPKSQRGKWCEAVKAVATRIRRASSLSDAAERQAQLEQFIGDVAAEIDRQEQEEQSFSSKRTSQTSHNVTSSRF